MAKLTEALKGASTILMAIVVAIMFVLLSPSGFAAETENVSYRCSCGKVFSSEAKWLKHKEKCDAIVVEETVPSTASTTESSTTLTTTAPTTTTPTTFAPTTAVPTTAPTTVKATEAPTKETTFIVPVIDYSDFVEEVVAENATTAASTTVATTTTLASESTTATTVADESTTVAESTTATTAVSTTAPESTTGNTEPDIFYAGETATVEDENEIAFPNTGSINGGVLAAIAVAVSSVLVISLTLKKKDT